MKNSASLANTNGRTYWRSLDHLADTPEFREWLEREFPQGASELTDALSRRHFVKIMSASFLLAGLGLSGCRRPERTILPFAKMPEDYVHGVYKFYATGMPTKRGAIPLVVRSHEGRPIKIGGNPDHPDSNGSTSLRAQASILDLYDPDRAQRFLKDGKPVSREEALKQLDSLSAQWRANQGEGVAFLAERSSSPSRARLQKRLAEKYPKAAWHVYEAVDPVVPGLGMKPYYSLENAEIVLSLDADFLSGEADDFRLIKGFADGRRIDDPEGRLNRLYVVEGLMTLTGTNADHRLRVATSQVRKVAAGIANEILGADPSVGAPLGGSQSEVRDKLRTLAGDSVIDDAWMRECASDLALHKGKCVIIAGERQPLIVHQIAAAMNAALGNVGKTVIYHREETSSEKDLAALVNQLNAGAVKDLVILGANPVYSAPADLDWPNAQKKAENVLRLGYYEDETAALCNWHLPQAHYLESWGDARTSDGTLVPVQPLVRPLFDGLTELETLARLAGETQTNPHDIVRATFKEINGAPDFEFKWKRFLHDGYLADSANAELVDLRDWPELLKSLTAPANIDPPAADRLEICFHADYSLGDGSHNNNGWLQELPDPITKLSWDNAVVVSPRTARTLGWKNSDVVQVRVGDQRVEAPVWIQPGTADFLCGLALGYGRTKTGRVGTGSGFNFYTLRTRNTLHTATDAQAEKTRRSYELASVQDHWSMTGRAIVREANFDQFQEHPDFATRIGMKANSPDVGGIYVHPYRQYENKLEKEKPDAALPRPIIKSQIHQWGMSIDLNACVGCAACTIACQSENNIPIVGKDQVKRGREMHWIRVDRYFAVDTSLPEENQTDNPQWMSQPMGCQHCETAPCETVCPVNATVHDAEGLNVMAYNRCVGTRYCSNNCPYKVRRFNFFDYNRRPIGKALYQNPITASYNGEWELKHWFKNPSRGSKPEEEWQLSKLVHNPDVSVRMRGVMEKCTYCLQRIEAAKIARKVKARDSGDVEVPDGAVKTACQEVCPAEAIVFGNLLDPDSKVSRLKKNPRDYEVLGYLDTRPRTTYLARVRNPNPKMPDYQPYANSFKEYMNRNGDPFALHEAPLEGHEQENGNEEEGEN